MGEPAAEIKVDHASYLALERAEDRRHECFDGRVYARIRVPETGLATYADDRNAMTNPAVLVEVLSDGAARCTRS